MVDIPLTPRPRVAIVVSRNPSLASRPPTSAAADAVDGLSLFTTTVMKLATTSWLEGPSPNQPQKPMPSDGIETRRIYIYVPDKNRPEGPRPASVARSETPSLKSALRKSKRNK